MQYAAVATAGALLPVEFDDDRVVAPSLPSELNQRDLAGRSVMVQVAMHTWTRARTVGAREVVSCQKGSVSSVGKQLRRASIGAMKSARRAKQDHQVPWTFVASAKRATPRRVLVSRIEASPQQPKRASRRLNTSQVGSRLEQAFIQAVKSAKRIAARKV